MKNRIFKKRFITFMTASLVCMTAVGINNAPFASATENEGNQTEVQTDSTISTDEVTETNETQNTVDDNDSSAPEVEVTEPSETESVPVAPVVEVAEPSETESVSAVPEVKVTEPSEAESVPVAPVVEVTEPSEDESVPVVTATDSEQSVDITVISTVNDSKDTNSTSDNENNVNTNVSTVTVSDNPSENTNNMPENSSSETNEDVVDDEDQYNELVSELASLKETIHDKTKVIGGAPNEIVRLFYNMDPAGFVDSNIMVDDGTTYKLDYTIACSYTNPDDGSKSLQIAGSHVITVTRSDNMSDRVWSKTKEIAEQQALLSSVENLTSRIEELHSAYPLSPDTSDDINLLQAVSQGYQSVDACNMAQHSEYEEARTYTTTFGTTGTVDIISNGFDVTSSNVCLSADDFNKIVSDTSSARDIELSQVQKSEDEAEQARLEAEKKAEEERKAREAAEKAEQERLEAEKKAEEERKAREAAEKAEQERLEAEKKAEEERKAREAAEKAEQERLAAEKKAEEERKAREAAEKAEQERLEAEKKAEEERKAREAAEKAEQERLEAEKKAEEERKAREAAEKAEQERLEAEKKAEEERKAREAAEKAEQERLEAEKKAKAEEEAKKKAEEERKAQEEAEKNKSGAATPGTHAEKEGFYTAETIGNMPEKSKRKTRFIVNWLDYDGSVAYTSYKDYSTRNVKNLCNSTDEINALVGEEIYMPGRYQCYVMNESDDFSGSPWFGEDKYDASETTKLYDFLFELNEDGDYVTSIMRTGAPDSADDSDAVKQDFHDKVNAERNKLNKAPLTLYNNEDAERIARERAIAVLKQWKEQGDISHYGWESSDGTVYKGFPSYLSEGTFNEDDGYYALCGENIQINTLNHGNSADYTAQQAFNQFYNSPGHYANMTDSGYAAEAVGIVTWCDVEPDNPYCGAYPYEAVVQNFYEKY